MHDPASKDLIQRLEQFTACRERDLQSCRNYVRRLSQDLPTFDSLWLDALVQTRRLTPFQADRLASGQEKSLQVGAYQLVSQILQDRVHFRYFGRQAESGGRVLIEEHRLAAPVSEQVIKELFAFKERLQRLPGTSRLLLPLDFVAREKSLFAVYQFEQGLTARELLIRRGRFPEKMIRLLTRQLLQQLQLMHEAGVVHGDLRAANLLLNHRGQMTLLNTGLRPIFTPHWTIQTELPFEVYDTLAPEVVSTGQWSAQTDLYSAGCLLWQLACGRPPLHSADPLLKLKAHLTRSIPDVREYAPEVDSETADAIYQLTRRQAVERVPAPLTFQELQQLPGYPSRQVLKSFIREFEQPLPVAVQSTTFQPRSPALLTGMACLVLLGVWLLSPWGGMGGGSWNLSQQWLLSIAAQQEQPRVESSEPETDDPAKESSSLWQKIPAPDEQGRIVLQAGARYQAEEIASVGPLLITTSDTNAGGVKNPSQNAVIVVGSQPWRLWATELTLQNITVSWQSSTNPASGDVAEELGGEQETSPGALLVCQSLNMRAERCRWMTKGDDNASASPVSLRAIAWKPLESQEYSSGQLQLINCEFLHAGSGLMLGGPAKLLALSNCLKVGSGTLLELADQFSGTQYPRIQCEHLTLREADSLLNLHFYRSEKQKPVELNIQGVNCVFQLRESAPGLICFTGTDDPAMRVQQLDLIGQILLLEPTARVCAWHNPEAGQSTAVELPGAIEGLIPYQIDFAAADLQQAPSSEILQYTGPRWNSVSPGIKAAELLPSEPTRVQ